MRLLFDNNLSPKLVAALSDAWPGSVHVREVGLQAAHDQAVWDYAKEQQLVIVSKDADFHQRSFLFGAPPKVVWIRAGNCSTAEMESLLKQQRSRILSFNLNPQAALLTVS